MGTLGPVPHVKGSHIVDVEYPILCVASLVLTVILVLHGRGSQIIDVEHLPCLSDSCRWVGETAP